MAMTLKTTRMAMTLITTRTTTSTTRTALKTTTTALKESGVASVAGVAGVAAYLFVVVPYAADCFFSSCALFLKNVVNDFY